MSSEAKMTLFPRKLIKTPLKIRRSKYNSMRESPLPSLMSSSPTRPASLLLPIKISGPVDDEPASLNVQRPVHSQLSNLLRVSDPNFNDIYDSYISHASVLYSDMSSTEVRDNANVKTKILIELATLFQNNDEVASMTNEQLQKAFDMVVLNLNRQVNPRLLRYLQNDYMSVIYEPMWCHIFYCYQILGRLVAVCGQMLCFNIDFVKFLLKLSCLPDPHERQQISNILRSYVARHKDQVGEILVMMSKQLDMVVDGVIQPYAASTAVSFLSYVCTSGLGFKIDYIRSLTQRSFLRAMWSHYFVVYSPQYMNFCASLVRQRYIEPSLFCSLIIQHWPKSNPIKEASFLRILTEVSALLSNDDSNSLSKPIFTIVGECAISEMSAVAEAAIDFVIKEPLHSLIVDHPKRALFRLWHPTLQSSTTHWSIFVREKAALGVRTLQKIPLKGGNRELRSACNQAIKDTFVSTVAPKWRLVAQIAYDNFQTLNTRDFFISLTEQCLIEKKRQKKSDQISGLSKSSSGVLPALIYSNKRIY